MKIQDVTKKKYTELDEGIHNKGFTRYVIHVMHVVFLNVFRNTEVDH